MDYDIPQNSRSCFVSGRSLRPGEVFYSAVFDTVTGLERRDYSAEHWTGKPDEAVGFWRGRLPDHNNEAKPEPITVDDMVQCFEKLAEDDSARSRRLRYVLALLLMRRKALKLQSIERNEDIETLVLARSNSKDTVSVTDPQLTEDEIEKAEAELYTLFDPTAHQNDNDAIQLPPDGETATTDDMTESSKISEME